MQDGSTGGEEAAIWLREHFKDDPAPRAEIGRTQSKAPDDDAYHRLLEILFSPHGSQPAA
ncbi:hypothetical protein ACGRHY_02765 [Streptomyces sp. HK10]|uniref:hypothetical protein n=1 Tax=Streptomyces sp. HK10 TaxID=3373255 RepID=UPI003749F231